MTDTTPLNKLATLFSNNSNRLHINRGRPHHLPRLVCTVTRQVKELSVNMSSK
jgi:hypothetical protein